MNLTQKSIAYSTFSLLKVFCLVLVLMFISGGCKKKGSEAPQRVGTESKVRQKPVEPVKPTEPTESARNTGTVRLQYKFKKAEVFHTQSQVTVYQELTGALSGTARFVHRCTIRHQVESVDRDGTASLKNRITRIYSRIRGPSEITFDSTKDSDLKKAKDDPNLQPLLHVLSAEFTLKLKPSGELMEYDLPKHMGTGDKDFLSGTRDMLDQFVEGAFILFPEKAIGVGDSWKGKLTAFGAGVGRLRVQYTLTLESLQSVDNEMYATISVSGDAKLEQDIESGIESELKHYEEEGRLLFALRRGWIVSSNMTTDCEIGFKTNDIMSTLRLSGKATRKVFKE